MESSYSNRGVLEGYLIGVTALVGITLVACAIPCFFGLRLSRQNDIARSCIPRLKAAICLFTLTAIAQATKEALNMSNFETGGTPHLVEAAEYIAIVASFLTNLAALSLFIVFAHVGTDILHLHYGAHDRPNPLYRYIIYVVVAVLAAIAVVELSLGCNLQHFVLNGGVQKLGYSDSIVQQLYTSGRMSLAFVIIGLLASVANLVYAIVVSVSTKATYNGTPSLYFIICSVLFLVHWIYRLVVRTYYADADGIVRRQQPLYTLILWYIFSLWPLLVDNTLLSIMGNKRTNGLRSEPYYQSKERQAF